MHTRARQAPSALSPFRLVDAFNQTALLYLAFMCFVGDVLCVFLAHRRGVLLFVDEADAFLRRRSTEVCM